MSGDCGFTIQDKVLITSFAITFGSCTRAMKEFQERYAKPPPPRTTIQHWKDVLLETGSLHPKPRSGRPSDEAMRHSVVEFVAENPTTTQRKAADHVGTSVSTVNRSLKKEGIKPFKYVLVQKLGEDDPDRRLQFCSWIQTKSIGFCRRIVFSDECSFYLNGFVRKHNLYYYARENEHKLVEIQGRSPALTVWAAVSFDLGITFHISRDTMNKERYVSVLQEKLLPFLAGSPTHWYQQDGAPPHFR